MTHLSRRGKALRSQPMPAAPAVHRLPGLGGPCRWRSSEPPAIDAHAPGAQAGSGPRARRGRATRGAWTPLSTGTDSLSPAAPRYWLLRQVTSSNASTATLSRSFGTSSNGQVRLRHPPSAGCRYDPRRSTASERCPADFARVVRAGARAHRSRVCCQAGGCG